MHSAILRNVKQAYHHISNSQVWHVMSNVWQIVFCMVILLMMRKNCKKFKYLAKTSGMEGDRKPCNRGTCKKAKCSHLNKVTSRAPQIPTTRPGADQVKPVASPIVGGAVTSTQILYVEPHFSETPSEYDIFYDCYSDVELNHPQINNNALINTKRSGGRVAVTPTGRDSKMFRDALKQVIVNAQALLVDYESGGGRGGRRGCGSRCRCDVRNIKPQTRTVQLEVTAKVANNKSSPPSNIRIDPITFTIPLKLHLQGQKQSQPNIAYTPSQQSYEGRRPFGVHEHDQNIPCVLNSMEPIRTAIITGTRQEAVSLGVPMEGPGPAFDFHAALLQQMTGIPAGLLQFPMPGVEEFIPPQTQIGTSKVQIHVPAAPPLKTLGSPTDVKMSQSKSKSNCSEVCSISQHQVPSVDPFTTPSLAPVNKGNFLATIAKSSMPSVVNAKSQQLSETGSQGVCVLCGRGGDSTKMQLEAASKGHCNMCSRGKHKVEAPPKPNVSAMPPPQKGPCGTCTAHRESELPTEPLVVLVPPQPSVGTTKRSCKMCTAGPPSSEIKQVPVLEMQSYQKESNEVLRGPCGKCTRLGKPAPPAPPPLEEPLIKVRGACGISTKGGSKPIESKPIIKASPIAPSTTPSGAPCGLCSMAGLPPKVQQSQQLAGDAGRSRCRVCAVKVESPAKLDRGVCGNCAGKAAAAAVETEGAPPMEAGKLPCGICSTRVVASIDVRQGSSAICTPTETGLISAKKEPCDICCKGAAPPPVTEKAPCAICAKGATTAVTVTSTSVVAVKAPCEICEYGADAPVTEAKGPCRVCARVATPPTLVEKGPCFLCTRTAAPAPMVEKGPCGICSRGAAPPPVPGKGPCGICSRGAAPPTKVERVTCDVRSSPSAPSVMSVHKKPCDICSLPAVHNQQPIPTTPCNICKKGPAVAEVSPNLCRICKKMRAPSEQPPQLATVRKEPCEICSKLSAQSADTCQMTPAAVAVPSSSAQPCEKCGAVGAPCGMCGQKAPSAVAVPSSSEKQCGKCGAVGAPCGMCSQQTTSAVPMSSNVHQNRGWCCLPVQPNPAPQAPPCISPRQPATPSTNCGTCLTSQPPLPPVIDYNCGTCLLPKPKEICSCFLEIGPKYYKALPQHKDIHICSPCRYDPSPLIDEEGKVFCPRNCGCCLCPWRKRGTDSQIDHIKHEKIKVCKCRAKGSIFIDYTSRAKCSNTSYFDCCPCRERAEAKYLEMFGEEMWTPNEKLRGKVRGEPVRLEDVVEYRRASTN